MRIALLTHSTNPRGGVVHTLELAHALHERGVEVTVIAPCEDEGVGAWGWFGEISCDVRTFRVRREANLVASIRARIDAYVEHLGGFEKGQRRATRFDVLHAQDGIGGCALATLTARGQIGVYLRTVHHLDQHVEEDFNRWEAQGIRAAREVLCVSQLWRERLRRQFGIDARVVGNGVNLARFNPQAQLEDLSIHTRYGLNGRPLIVCVGGIEQRKNTVRILEGFEQLMGAHPGAQLAIVGGSSILDHSAYRRQFDQALKSSGLTHGPKADVVVTGAVGEGEVAALLRAADAVAFASLREGFGLVALEALACGTPTVVSRIAPFTEFLGDEVFWAEPTDAGSIARALDAAVAAQKFSPPQICQTMSWRACAQRHLDIYRSCLEHA